MLLSRAVVPVQLAVRSVRAGARPAQAVFSSLERTNVPSEQLHPTRGTNGIPHEQPGWPREESNLRTRIRSLKADEP